MENKNNVLYSLEVELKLSRNCLILKLILMEKLEVTVEVLETKELSTITTIIDKSGTTGDQTSDNGASNTTVYACCTTCCCC